LQWECAIGELGLVTVVDMNGTAPFQTPQQLASGFKPASRTRVSEIIETLTALGQTRKVEDKYLL